MKEKRRDLQERLPIWMQDYVGKLSLIGFSDHVKRTRKVQDKDLEKVMEIYNHNFQGESEKRMRRYRSLFKQIFYVIDDPPGHVQGYCVYYMRLRVNGRHLCKVATLFSIAIDERAQGKGLGNILLEESLNDLSKNGVSKVRLYVNTLNEPAIVLYKKQGFEVIDEVRDICGQGFTCLKMEMSLENIP